MASSAQKYLQELGSALQPALGNNVKFFKSRAELREKSGAGDNVLVLSGSNKYSPLISLAFYFGRNFEAAKNIEKQIGEHQSYYHIHQYSLNLKLMKKLSYSGPHKWILDINKPFEPHIPEIAGAIQGMSQPFFDRFGGIEAARDALAADDTWCIGGKASWRNLLLLDAAIGDLSHFSKWAASLEGFSRTQADEALAKIVSASNYAA